jgi:hypothetical protein
MHQVASTGGGSKRTTTKTLILRTDDPNSQYSRIEEKRAGERDENMKAKKNQRERA